MSLRGKDASDTVLERDNTSTVEVGIVTLGERIPAIEKKVQDSGVKESGTSNVGNTHMLRFTKDDTAPQTSDS